MLKAPFTTNGFYVKFPKTYTNLLKCVNSACSNLLGTIPYVMVQACMHNRKEYKVVMLDGVAQYVASILNHDKRKSQGGINKAFSFYPHARLFKFAEDAVEVAKQTIPLISDGLFRVDIFETINGSLVVNEFESLEADFPSGHLSAGGSDTVNTFLISYWSRKILACVHTYVINNPY